MRIVCPQCGYSRDIPADKVPARSSIATCPKCQFRFRFRGASPSSRPDDVADEPVYPPKPSRPSVEREPYDGSTPSRFDARSSRIYQPEPESEPEHYGHVPPRPQARWLPDPEPGYGEPEAAPRPRPARAKAVQEEPESSAPEGLEAPWERIVPGQIAQSGIKPEEPLDFHDEKPAPWERMSLRESAEPEPVRAVPEPVIERVEPAPAPVAAVPDEGGLPPEYAMPQPGEQPPVQAPAEEHVDESPEDTREEIQPTEAVAGDDSVRDIWARLQAMGGGVQPPPAAPTGREEPAEERTVPIGPDTVAPWEQLEHYGVVPAFMATAKNVLLKPGDFFDQLPPASGKVRPLIFAMVVCLLTAAACVVWNYFGMGPNFSELGRTDGFQGLGAGAIGGLALLGLAPLALVAFVFLDAGLTQLLLSLLRSSSRSFEETFRNVCYAGTPWLLAALPVPFSYLIPVVLIWHMTLQAIGLKKLHGAGYPQVLASVLVKWSLYFMASFAILHVLITRR